MDNAQRDNTTTTDDDDQSQVSSNSSNDHRNSNGSKTSSVVEYGRELFLTKSQGGTLGAAAVPGSYAESAVSDTTSNFYFMTKQYNAVNTNTGATFGARAVDPEEKE